MDLPMGSGAAGPSNVLVFLTKLWTLVSNPDTVRSSAGARVGTASTCMTRASLPRRCCPSTSSTTTWPASCGSSTCMVSGRWCTSSRAAWSSRSRTTQSSSTPASCLLLTDVQLMKGKQESMDSKLLAMKHENKALWREVASLRQKHAQQQKVVNKLIQFLISLVQSNRILGVKRKIPLMLNDSGSAHSLPKYSRQYSLEPIHGSSPYSAPSPAYRSSSLYSPDAISSSGPIISDITELTPSSPVASPDRSIDEWPLSSSPLVPVKEDPPSPPWSTPVEEASPGCQSSIVDTPLSPTALIDSILRESEPAPAASATTLPDAGGPAPLNAAHLGS
ncbi:Heat shock factor protein 1 [Myotis davidii]|uniref:Heat shock factor protein 1 n=1 Tax=Myotis davidii TaxID=225400 RepID=L5MJI6_MYODS|nr:Heat shock factor protein 1 [Myotis davidii]